MLGRVQWICRPRLGALPLRSAQSIYSLYFLSAFAFVNIIILQFATCPTGRYPRPCLFVSLFPISGHIPLRQTPSSHRSSKTLILTCAYSRRQAIDTYELYFANCIGSRRREQHPARRLAPRNVFCTIIAYTTCALICALTPVRLPPVLYADLANALPIAFHGGV